MVTNIFVYSFLQKLDIRPTLGQSCRIGTMHFLKGELEVLALDVFLWISLNLYECHITHLIVDNLNFFQKICLLPFLLIQMSHHCIRKK